ncbi:PIG-L deacetylase family protein [Streptomyces cinereoruber]|uniref:PIG-L deacetylase family protein n=1 Tax=Streptomyces cinereoruber TaxID=67260 RepID=UPI00362DF6C0
MLTKVATPKEIKKLGTILGIWAHPDDEAYTSGGLMKLAADAGQRVVCITATAGELGTSDPDAWPPEVLRPQRISELKDCLATLGVREHYWLDYADGGCADSDEQIAVQRIAEIIDHVKADTVLTFGPDGYTGHSDHIAISRWATAAFAKSAISGSNLLYVTASVDRVAKWETFHQEYKIFESGYPSVSRREDQAVNLQLSGAVLETKVEALKKQVTQTKALVRLLGIQRYSDWVSEESFLRFTDWPS